MDAEDFSLSSRAVLLYLLELEMSVRPDCPEAAEEQLEGQKSDPEAPAAPFSFSLTPAPLAAAAAAAASPLPASPPAHASSNSAPPKWSPYGESLEERQGLEESLKQLSKREQEQSSALSSAVARVFSLQQEVASAALERDAQKARADKAEALVGPCTHPLARCLATRDHTLRMHFKMRFTFVELKLAVFRDLHAHPGGLRAGGESGAARGARGVREKGGRASADGGGDGGGLHGVARRRPEGPRPGPQRPRKALFANGQAGRPKRPKDRGPQRAGNRPRFLIFVPRFIARARVRVFLRMCL